MTYVDAALRRLVIERAKNHCEYCLLNQDDVGFAFHIEHIIAEKHEGETESGNLCLSCPECNTFKGTDIGSIDRSTGLFTPLFNPRQDLWIEHFRLNGPYMEALTPSGRVTVSLLRFNLALRVEERAALIKLKRYPPQWIG